MNRIIIAVLVFFAIVQTPQTSYSQNHKWCVGDCMVNRPPPGSEGGPAGSPGGGITPEEACSMTTACKNKKEVPLQNKKEAPNQNPIDHISVQIDHTGSKSILGDEYNGRLTITREKK